MPPLATEAAPKIHTTSTKASCSALSHVKTVLRHHLLSNSPLKQVKQILIRWGTNNHERRSDRETVGGADVRCAPGGRGGTGRNPDRSTHHRNYRSVLSRAKTALNTCSLSDNHNLSDICCWIALYEGWGQKEYLLDTLVSHQHIL